jgi:signal transduction histidine kinase
MFRVMRSVRRARLEGEASGLLVAGDLEVTEVRWDDLALGDPIFDHPEAGECAGRQEAEPAALTSRAVDRERLYQEAQQELTVRRMAEHEKEAFLDAVAHDLANPLAAVKAQTQLLQRRVRHDRADTATLETGLAAIDAATDRAIRLIAELTDYARFEALRPLDLHRAPTDLVALTTRIVNEFQGEVSAHRLRLDAAEPSMTGLWDADRLERVLENILSNAVKYSPIASTIDIGIDREDASDGTYVVLTVADQGVGIPASDLPHIFERFRRGSNVAGRVVGSGLGLWGSQQIVAQHGGTIAITSAEDQGTVVTVRLPLSTAAETADAYP